MFGMFLIITVVIVSGSCVSVSAAVVALLSERAASGCLNSKRVSHPPLQLLGPLQLPTRTTPFCGCCLPDADAVAAASEAEAGDDDVADVAGDRACALDEGVVCEVGDDDGTSDPAS